MAQSAQDNHGRSPSHGIISRDYILITGGEFVAINNIFSTSVPSQQQQVLEILCPPVGPSRIDGRLLHNSNEYGDVRLGSCQHIPATPKAHLRHILEEIMNHLPKRGTLRRRSSHYIHQGSSKHVSIPVAERLACQGVLLATIIIPGSTPPCTKFIVPTLAYQLVQNIPSSAEYMLAALRKDPGIFGRNTETQFKELFKFPLKMAYMNASIAEKVDWPNTIVLDGNAQEISPGSVAHWILQSFSALPVNTITLIEAHSQDRDLHTGPRSLAQRLWNFILSFINYLRS